MIYKDDLVTIMKGVADGMKPYDTIRTGGNLGTAIMGMLIHNGAEKIAESINTLARAVERSGGRTSALDQEDIIAGLDAIKERLDRYAVVGAKEAKPTSDEGIIE